MSIFKLYIAILHLFINHRKMPAKAYINSKKRIYRVSY